LSVPLAVTFPARFIIRHILYLMPAVKPRLSQWRIQYFYYPTVKCHCCVYFFIFTI